MKAQDSKIRTVSNMAKKLTAIILLLAMLLSASACSKKEKSVGEEIDSDAVIWSDNNEISFSMYTYFFNAYYKSFTTRYADYLENMELDTAKPLRDQTFREERSWFEYLMILCFDEVTETLALADAAKDTGKELSDEDIEIIDAALEEYDTAAEKRGMSSDEYIAMLFGEKVNRVTLEKCLRLQRRAAAQYSEISSADAPDTEDCQLHFEENKNNYLHYDCLRIIVSKENSALLTTCKDDKEFTEAMRKIITDTNFDGNYEKFSDKINTLVENKLYKRCSYVEDEETAKWAYDAERKPYDIFTEAARENDVAVCMILPTSEPGAYSSVLYRDFEPVRDVQYVQFSDDDEAKAVYDEWKKDGSEKGFAALCDKYTGGTNENIDRSYFEGELGEWIFADDTEVGDSTAITLSDGKTYLLYLLNIGEPSWLVDVKRDLRESETDNRISELKEKYASQYSAAIYNVEEVAISAKQQ